MPKTIRMPRAPTCCTKSTMTHSSSACAGLLRFINKVRFCGDKFREICVCVSPTASQKYAIKLVISRNLSPARRSLSVADQAPRVGRDGVGVRGDRHLGGDAEQGAGDQGGGARAHRGHRSAGMEGGGGGVYRVIHVVAENLLLT